MADIKIYSTQTCPYCHKAKSYISLKNAAYTDIDVSKDSKGLDEMVKLSGQTGVPVIVINGQVIVGFDRVKIDKFLK